MRNEIAATFKDIFLRGIVGIYVWYRPDDAMRFSVELEDKLGNKSKTLFTHYAEAVAFALKLQRDFVAVNVTVTE